MTNEVTNKTCEVLCDNKKVPREPEPCINSAKVLMFNKSTSTFKYACGSHQRVLLKNGFKVNHFLNDDLGDVA